MKDRLWNDFDLIKAALLGSVIGLVVGFVAGYEWAWRPVVDTFRPLIG